VRSLLLFAFLVGCSSSEEAPATQALSFEKDIVPILDRSCGSKDNDCHGRAAFHPNPAEGCRGWLSLENAAIGSTIAAGADQGKQTGCTDMALYDRLTKLDAWECGDPYFKMFARRKYVTPGKPAESHLLNKMNGGPQCGVPNVMPKGGKADPADIDTITKWIAAGAPR
jgi:hypothetical protein